MAGAFRRPFFILEASSAAEFDYRHVAVDPVQTIGVNAAQIFQASAVVSLLLCSCATPHSPRPRLPPEISFNRGAGRGDFLFVTVRLNKSCQRSLKTSHEGSNENELRLFAALGPRV
jgi:hypothetical protein